MEITINIKGLDGLTEAIAFLASAIGHHNGMENTVKASDDLKNEEQKKDVSAEEKAVCANVDSKSVEPKDIPTSKPAYTFEQIQLAAATLARSGKRDELGNLLKEFELTSLPDLTEDKFDAFVLRLRDIGGTI